MDEARHRIMVVFGTRPEAIKMAPVVHALATHPRLEPIVIVTGQHRRMLDEVLSVFELVPDADLDVMEPAQSLPNLTARVLQGMTGVLSRFSPHMVLVHGDTTTTLSVSLAAFYARIPVGHVEAGLRTGNMQSPWPEEMNRRLTTPLCDLHFAPTRSASDNLLREGIPAERVHVTGNTVVDALLQVASRIRSRAHLKARLSDDFQFLAPDKQTLLVTGHRRENFGGGLERICRALATLATRTDLQIVYPVHLNPNVHGVVHRLLANHPNIHLIDPLDYVSFVYLLGRCDVVLTDSGGVQEEAPSLGKPVLVMRDATERPEAVDAGTTSLVGTDPDRIVSSVNALLDDVDLRQKMIVATNPYGDGGASKRIVDAIWARFQQERGP